MEKEERKVAVMVGVLCGKECMVCTWNGLCTHHRMQIGHASLAIHRGAKLHILAVPAENLTFMNHHSKVLERCTE